MKLENYHVKGEEKIVSPALIYYRDAIVKNTQRTIELAGGANRLWYHVKTHKTRELVKMQMEMGFTHFMCATISEAEMAASVGAENVLVAYALVGPNIERFIDLTLGMPGTQFWALGDDYDTLLQLSAAAREKGITIPVLLDVNVGQDRTGVLLSETADYYERCSRLPNLQMRGLHCYDGHNHQVDVEERQKAVDEMDRKIEEVRQDILGRGIVCDTVIVGGTPSFPCKGKRLFPFSGNFLCHGCQIRKRCPGFEALGSGSDYDAGCQSSGIKYIYTGSGKQRNFL